MHRQAQPEVRVVIKICAGGNDPIDEARLNQRNQCGHAKPCWCQRAGQRDANGHVGLEHLFGEELTSLSQTRSVISNECVVDEVDQLCRRTDRLWIDPSSTQKFTLLLCQDY